MFINSVFGYGSTGKIVLDLAKKYEYDGYEVKIAYGRTDRISYGEQGELKKYGVRIGNYLDIYLHVLYTRLTDKHGLVSKQATRKFLKWADDYNPDIVWLHNIHGYYINYELLFKWIKMRPQMHVKWTLHDCWAFTGHCSYFTYIGCDKWKYLGHGSDRHINIKAHEQENDVQLVSRKVIGCYNCQLLNQYPKAIRDNCIDNYIRKKMAFTGVKDIKIYTPSIWLKNLVGESFLSEYSVEVRYNCINTDIFKPTQSTFKQDHGIQDDKMLLGVASIWERRKGLDDFIKLSKRLTDCYAKNGAKYKIVLVGLTNAQIREIHEETLDIIGIPRTSNLIELAQIYSAADVFINPTYEDNYPTVNLEAEACGTPVITYDTGGCRETIKRKDSRVVAQGVENIASIIFEMM